MEFVEFKELRLDSSRTVCSTINSMVSYGAIVISFAGAPNVSDGSSKIHLTSCKISGGHQLAITVDFVKMRITREKDENTFLLLIRPISIVADVD